jgi:excisionase family DNA binding protein
MTTQQIGASTPKYLTADQLGELLQLSTKSVLQLAKRGKIPSINVGPRSRRFDLERVLAALQRADDHRSQTP